MSEKEWKKAIGIKEEEHIPSISRKNASHKNAAPTLSNHDTKKVSSKPLMINLMDNHISDIGKKVVQPKKSKAVTDPLQTNPKKKPMSIEEKREYKRTYMKNYRKLHPTLSYQSVKKWRDNHPEENLKRRREEASKRRAKKKLNEVIL
ncbi:MAG: hypothetical protein V2A75_07810 [Pseudomonadota bacterium]